MRKRPSRPFPAQGLFSNKQIPLIAMVVFAMVGSFFIWRSFAANNPNLTGDLNADNKVTLQDLSILLASFGKASTDNDLSGDGKVSLTDLSLLLANYGKVYTPPGTPTPTPPAPTPTPTPPAPTPTPPSPTPTPGNSPIPSTAKLLFSGDYNNGNLSQWTTLQTTDRNASPGTYCTYSACVKDGGAGHTTAARFEVRPGDVPDFGGGERSEVAAHMAAALTHSGDERWYEFSFKVDPGFQPCPGANSGGHCILMQWHSGSGSPPLHLGFDASNNMIIGHRWDSNKKVVGPVDPGNWHDYVMHVKFSTSSSTGFVEMWRDGQLVVPKTARATMASGENYLKQGLYRADENFTQVLWHDNFRIYEP